MIMMTALTYFWYGMMVLICALVWLRNVALPTALAGIILTMVIFYTLFWHLRDRTRTIRSRR